MATKILIVEDEPLLAETLSLQLKKNGYKISGIATNLTDAVHILKTRDADLAIIDIGLDGPEDGVKTAVELVKIKSMPVIYITGRPLQELLPRVKNTMPAAFLSKPIRADEVIVQIELALYNFSKGNLPSMFWQDSDLFFVPYSKGLLGLHVNDILFFKSDSNYATVYLKSDAYTRLNPGSKAYAPIQITIPMGRLYSELPPYFFQLSRFEVINLKQISQIGKGYLLLENHQRPIPDGRRAALFTQLRIIQRRKGGDEDKES